MAPVAVQQATRQRPGRNRPVGKVKRIIDPASGRNEPTRLRFQSAKSIPGRAWVASMP